MGQTGRSAYLISDFCSGFTKSQNGIYPQTKKKIKIAASRVPRFRATKALKEAAKQAG